MFTVPSVHAFNYFASGISLKTWSLQPYGAAMVQWESSFGQKKPNKKHNGACKMSVKSKTSFITVWLFSQTKKDALLMQFILKCRHGKCVCVCVCLVAFICLLKKFCIYKVPFLLLSCIVLCTQHKHCGPWMCRYLNNLRRLRKKKSLINKKINKTHSCQHWVAMPPHSCQ